MPIINQDSAQQTAQDLTLSPKLPQAAHPLTPSSSDAQRAAAALAGKQTTYNTYWQYYDGDHPQVYTNKKLAEIFRNIDITFNENWCAAVIDATADRIQLVGAELRTKKAQKAFDTLWRDLALDVESDDCHTASLVTGESFLVAWDFPSIGSTPVPERVEGDAYFNDPRLCHIFYRPDRPKIKQFAAKWWFNQQTNHIQLTLYYPDRLEYYTANDKGNQFKPNMKFRLRSRAQNPHGIIPVFHFRPERRTAKSDLKNAIPIQIAINKLVNDLMVTAEFAAFKQRWIISQSDKLDKLKNAPNEIWEMPAGDGVGQNTQVGQFDASDPRAYIQPIDHFAAAMATITRTPKHLFFRQQGNISGEALLTMESPLTRKVNKRIDRFTPEWRDAFAFLMQLHGHTISPADITPIFQPGATVQPFTQAQTRNLNKSAGIPIITQLRREGWTQSELTQLAQDAEQEIGAIAIPDAANQ